MIATYQSIKCMDNIADDKDGEEASTWTDEGGCKDIHSEDEVYFNHLEQESGTPSCDQGSGRIDRRCSCRAMLTLCLAGVLICVVSVFVRENGATTFDRDNRPTMVPLVWNETTRRNNNITTTTYHAILEFCQQDGPDANNSVYGYRLPGETTCGPAGVVIRIKPGRSYQLTLHNMAKKKTITNLHTHGLHLSGSGNADDITRTVESGMCLTYHWDVLPTSMGGTFWIHAHPAPPTLTKRQLDGGAFALLIVEENENLLENVNDPTDRLALNSWLNQELLLVVGIVFVNDHKGRASPSSNDDGGSAKRVVSANGRFLDDLPISLQIKADEWYRLRILTFHSKGRRGVVPLQMPETCQVYVVANDGVWRFQVPNPIQQHFFNETGASRMDVAIKCPHAELQQQHAIQFGPDMETIAVLETKTTTTATSTQLRINGDDESEPSQDLSITGSPFLTSNRQPWEPSRPDYLQDLSSIHDKNNNYNVENEVEKATAVNFLNITLDKRTIAGQSWDADEPWMHLRYGTLQEWTIFGSSTHPFHSHVFHMQTFGCKGHEDGQYYDTISVDTTNTSTNDNDNDRCVVRFRVMDYGERVVIHCHNAGHEDDGMMIWYQVDGGPLQDSTGREQMTCPI